MVDRGRPGRYRGPMARTAVAIVAVSLSGCAYGIGIVDVGTTRTSHVAVADTVVTSDAMVGNTRIATTETGPTTDMAQTSASAHFGVMVGVHGGGNFNRVGDTDGNGPSLETFIEMLGGKGRWALGVRTGILGRGGDTKKRTDGTEVLTGHGSFPITLHGYYGLSPSLSTHVGLGYDMFTFGDRPRAVRVMTGLRMALSSSEHGATLLVLDLDHARATRDEGAYRSYGLIGGFALVR